MFSSMEDDVLFTYLRKLFILKNQVKAKDFQESLSINEFGIVISDLYSCFENDSSLSTILVYPTFIALP